MGGEVSLDLAFGAETSGVIFGATVAAEDFLAAC